MQCQSLVKIAMLRCPGSSPDGAMGIQTVTHHREGSLVISETVACLARGGKGTWLSAHSGAAAIARESGAAPQVSLVRLRAQSLYKAAACLQG